MPVVLPGRCLLVRRSRARRLLAAALALPAAPATAQQAPVADPPAAASIDGPLALHGQATLVVQAAPPFRSPYQGPNSLAGGQVRETVDATLFAGARLWRGAEAWANPEVDQGFGLSDTLGVAAFPSAEAYKVGRREPYLRLQRLFVRQTIGLSGGEEAGPGGANRFGGPRPRDRLVVTAGKLAVGDVFDANAYAHDPRADLLNWALVDAGSFDYAADAWGYTTGVAAELYAGDWTVRAGLFNLSRVPNGTTLETGFGQRQLDAEVEHRHRLAGRPGAVRATLFSSRGRFGRYDDALAAAGGGVPALDPVRRPRTRLGVHVGAEQALSDAVGVFARAGLADGGVEPYEFTDVDRTAQAGVAVAGRGWGRANDALVLAAVANGVSAAHRRYLAAGGLGLLIGDGRLPRAGPELAAEAQYRLALRGGVALTADWQLVVDPAYNRERGPANVLALRLHGEF